MLNNIKSFYYLKLLLSHLDEKKQLELIIYNNALKNILDIKLINYKIMSGKYIINEDNNIIKEYNGYNDKLIYEGEFFKGKRNGKGKEYENCKLIFEGEYLKGKKWDGIGYDYNKEIIYELKGGKGFIKEYKEYYFNQKIKFEGELLNGEKNGRVKEYFTNSNIKFEGEYLNGKKHGKGKEYFINGNALFNGYYRYGKMWNGKIYEHNNNLLYELREGKGFIKEFDNVDFRVIYEGEYLNGERNGKGKEYNKFDDILFEGEYLNGKKHGEGEEYYIANSKLAFKGEYLYGHRIKGKQYYKNKIEFEGEYLYDKKYNGKGYDENGNITYELNNGNGKVKEYTTHGYLLFEGEYLNGKRNGYGIEYNLDGGKFVDYFKNGNKRDGTGYTNDGRIDYEIIDGNGMLKEYCDGELIYTGEYFNGKRYGKGKLYDHLNGKLKYFGMFD